MPRKPEIARSYLSLSDQDLDHQNRIDLHRVETMLTTIRNAAPAIERHVNRVELLSLLNLLLAEKCCDVCCQIGHAELSKAEEERFRRKEHDAYRRSAATGWTNTYFEGVLDEETGKMLPAITLRSETQGTRRAA